MLQSGTVLAGRYEILEMLGEGGMGAVYKARDRELTRTVALKVIRPDLVRNPAIVERFKQELRLSHQVTHKNVIRIYDLGEVRASSSSRWSTSRVKTCVPSSAKKRSLLQKKR